MQKDVDLPGCRAFSPSVFLSSQRIGQPRSPLGSSVRMRFPPLWAYPLQHTHIFLTPTPFSFSTSSLCPVQGELGLGRIPWQTLTLDLLFFISYNQRKKNN